MIFSELIDAKSLFLTANADTVYYFGVLDLSKGPMVLEVPPRELSPTSPPISTAPSSETAPISSFAARIGWTWMIGPS
jgi:Protein of unknown function (DUF1254)